MVAVSDDGRVLRFEKGGFPQESPFAPGDTVVCWQATAEMGCFHVLGWERPPQLLDLFIEAKVFEHGAVND